MHRPYANPFDNILESFCLTALALISTLLSQMSLPLTQQQNVGMGFLTFTPSPRPQDLAPQAIMGAMQVPGELPEPLPDFVGVRTLAPGVVEIDHRPLVTQGSGTLQGGIVALLGEMAAETLTGHQVVELDTRYLATVRVGPARTAARRTSPWGVRVEVRDTGNGDRLAALVHARVDEHRATASG